MTLYQSVSYSSSLLDTVQTCDELEVEVLRLHGKVLHNAQLATMSSQARWRYQARSHLEHIFWWLTHRHVPPSNLYMSDLDSWLDSTPF